MILLKNITKNYYIGKQEIKVIKKISLNIKGSEFVAILGKSGSGKSTLMNIIGLLDDPTEGTYFLDGKDVSKIEDDDRAEIRGKRIGFVFQLYNLIPRLPVIKQVMLPLMYQGVNKEERKLRSKKALKMVGLSSKLDNKPTELSGGEQQRVAIARAIVTEPSVILADEPTGSLDSKTGREIMNIFRKLNEAGKTIIIVTHDPKVASYSHRKIIIKDGKIIRKR